MPQAFGFVVGLVGFAAPAIGAASFGGWVAGAAFGSTVLGGIAAKLLTSVAISALSQALAPSTGQGGGITISTTARGETQPETIILGRTATAGHAICPPLSHGKSNKYLTHVIELCSAPGATLERLILDDDYVELGTTAHPDYGLPVLGDYEDLVWVKYYNGSQTTADPMLRAKYGDHPDRPWTADMVGAGLCYAILTFKFDREDQTQVPRYRFEMRGLPLYDIRKDSTAGGSGAQRWNNPATWTQTENPAVIAWNIMRGITLPGGEVWGGRIAAADLPNDVWMPAMNRCDLAVTLQGGGTEPAYRCGLEVALSTEPASALEEVLKAASAQVADIGGTWKILVGAPALPVYSFSDDDVIVSQPQEFDPFPALSETYNAVAAQYPDPDSLWETKDAPIRTNATWEASDAFGRRTADLQLPAVPYKRQVQRLMRAWIEDERRLRRHMFSLPPDAAIVEPLDTLDYSSARNGYINKDFSVAEITEDLHTCIRKVSIRERDPLDYDWQPGFELPSTPTQGGTTYPAPETVSGFGVSALILTDAEGRGRRVALQLVWDADILARGLRWQIRRAGQTAVEMRGGSQDVDAGEYRQAEGILPDTAYEVRARIISGRPTSWTGWIGVVTPALRLGPADIDWSELEQDILQDLAELENWINGEVTDLSAAIVAETQARVAALQAQAEALAAEAAVRAAAIQAQADALAAEAAARAAAVQAQADNLQDTADALADEVAARAAAVQAVADGLQATAAGLAAESAARVAAVEAVADDLQTTADALAAETAARVAAVQNVADDLQDTADALAAESVARVAAVQAVADGLQDTAEELAAESTARAAEARQLAESYRGAARSVAELRDWVADLDYRRYEEQDQLRRDLVTELQTTRASASEQITTAVSGTAAVAERVTTLEAVAGDLEALIVEVDTARVDGENALAQQLAALAVGTANQFDHVAIWYWDASVEGWTGAPGAPGVVGGHLRPAYGAGASLTSPAGLAVDADRYAQVRARLRRIGAPVWAGYLWWAAPGQGWDTARRVAITAPDWVDGIGLVTISPAWTGTVDRIRLELVAAPTVTDQIDVDWLAIGRPAPGASSAELAEERTARITADTAAAQSITDLQTAINGLDGTTAATATAVTALTGRVSTAEGQISAQVEAITGLQVALPGKADGSVVTALTTRVTETEEALRTSAEAVTAVRSSLLPLEAASLDQAFAAHLQARDVREAVTAAEQSLTTRIALTDDKLLLVSESVTRLEATVPGLASATALDALTTRVVVTEDRITAAAQSITDLQSTLPGLASVTALDALTTRVAQTETGITAVGQQITELTAEVDGKANGTALTALTTRVTETETALRTSAEAVTAVRSSLLPLEAASLDQAFAAHLQARDVREAVTAAEQSLTTRIALTDDKLLLVSESVTRLEATVPGLASATALDALTTRVVITEDRITAAAQSITDLQSTLPGLASVTALDALTTRVAQTETGLTAQGQLITQLTAAVEGKAESSALLALTSRVTESEGKIVSFAEDMTALETAVADKANSSVVSALTSRVAESEDRIVSLGEYITSLETAVSGKASSAALSALTSRVTATENTTVSLGQQITSLQGEVAGKASGAALNSLTSRVTATEDTTVTLNQQITSLQGEVAGKASGSALSALTSRVADTETRIVSFGEQITTLEAEVDGKASGTAVATLSSRVTATEDATITLGQQITSLQGQIDGKASASAVSALTSRMTSAEGAIILQGQAITSIQNQVDGKADAEALQSLTGRVSDTEDGLVTFGESLTSLQGELDGKASGVALSALTSRVSSTESGIVSLNQSITSLQGEVAGKANGAAVNALTSRVTATEDATVTLNQQITSLQGEVAGKASGAALNSLTSRVSEAEGTINAQGQAITSIQNQVNGKANADAVQALASRVTGTEDNIEAVASAVTSLGITVDGKASQTAVNGLTSRMTAAEGNISGQAQAITNLQAAVPGFASVSAVDALTIRMSGAEGAIATQADALQALATASGKYSAGGRFRTTVEATPAGASARIGLSVSAGEAANTNTAALFLTAESDGTSSVLVRADRFAVANGALTKAPFIIEDGDIFLRDAVIKNASITTLMLRGNAVTLPIRTFDPAWQDITSTDWITVAILKIIRRGLATELQFGCSMDGYGNGVTEFALTRNGLTTIIRSASAAGAPNGRQSQVGFTMIDWDRGTGQTTYRIRARKAAPARTAGWNANMRLGRRYFSAIQFSR